MKSYVLDASVAVAWYLPEAFATAARRWRQKVLEGDVRLLVPGLHYWEMGNVLRTYVKRRELDEALAREIYALHVEAPLEAAEPERGAVLATAVELDATVYDAVYIALSRQVRAPLLTAERTTTPWVARLGRGVEIVRA